MNYLMRVYFGLALCIPLSFGLPFGHFQINIPAEIIMGGLALALLVYLKPVNFFSHPFMNHPVSKIYMIYFGWMLITTITSSQWLVSAKYLAVSFTHWWVFYCGFYFLGLQQKLNSWIRFYSFGLLPVIILIWYRFAVYEFNLSTAVILAKPFYDDHTILSASLMLLLPLIGYEFIQINKRKNIHILFYALWVIMVLATLVISFSRAAWISLLLATGLAIAIINWKLKFWPALAWFSGLSVFFIVLTVQFTAPKSPATASVQKITLFQKIKSISNWYSDVSNLERLNRYKCAWRMFLDRPLVGFGPGTFPDRYLSYQRPEDMTRLSVTTPTGPDGQPHPQGRGGSTHSEYLQNLSEQGLPGFLLWMVLVLVSSYTGFRAYHRAGQKNKGFILVLMCTLVAYFIHLLFNNFLHSEKADALFMPVLAALVSLDKEY